MKTERALARLAPNHLNEVASGLLAFDYQLSADKPRGGQAAASSLIGEPRRF
jgi:hypothetical protein